jgi:hypothetical protein
VQSFVSWRAGHQTQSQPCFVFKSVS